MQSDDISEFEQILGELCAAYELPMTKARKDAYWSGLKRMSLAQFRRCVDVAASDEGPADFPTTKGIWRILRGGGSGGSFERARAPGDDRDHLDYFANRLLYVHLAGRGGVGSLGAKASAELEACLKLKGELIDWFLAPVRDGDELATPAEFLRQWMEGLQRISRIEKSIYDRWAPLLEDPLYLKPFPTYMARDLAGAQQQAMPV